MKKIIFAIAALSSAVTHAETSVQNDLMFMASVTSDYRFRGISQSRLKPAIQAGVDYVNNPSGFYVGAWASTIKWIDDAGGDSEIELDIYGGKRGEITENITYDVGVLAYVYPSNTLGDVEGYESANTTEVYAQIGYGPGFIKYSNSVTNLFGFVDSKNSGYIDATVNIPVGSFTVNLHAGHQTVENNSMADYDDWKVGATPPKKRCRFILRTQV
ncbi:MAG: hypothetical protein EOO68_25130 [Moraxellaceae bacterium]|nr:MAG: hypothetical protein EOO68_25130 [Moraxellaceae bacterium]